MAAAYFIPLFLTFFVLIVLKTLTRTDGYTPFPDNFPRVIDFIWIGIIALVPILNMVFIITFVILLFLYNDGIKWKDTKFTRFLRK